MSKTIEYTKTAEERSRLLFGDELNGMREEAKPVSLKELAEHLGLSKTTVSIVMNNAPGAKTIALATRQRIRDAAEKLHYHPNLHAHILGMRHRSSDPTDEDAQFTSTEVLIRRVHELEDENAKLKHLVANLCLDKSMRKGI